MSGLHPMRIKIRFNNGNTVRSLMMAALPDTAVILATGVCRCSCHFKQPVNRISNDPQLSSVFYLQTAAL